MSTKDIQKNLAADMENWMSIEDTTVAATGAIIKKTKNPVIRTIMEIIQRDSQAHHQTQKFIRDTLTKTPVTLTPDELAEVWSMISRHIEIEEQSVELAKSAIQAIKGKKMLVQEYLLTYLLIDEKKHVTLLKTLSKIQKGMYPYA